MSRTLAIAAGGGGDAITASVIARKLGDYAPAIMSYSWDRLLIDPLPGPRSHHDFTGLKDLRRNLWEVLPSSAVNPPGDSTLPRLADSLPCHLLLLDPYNGAEGMAEQIAAAAEYFNADELAVIDVGGDAIAEGHEHELRSPTADFLALAAARRTEYPVQLLTTGIALDGELSEPQVMDRLQQHEVTVVASLTFEDFSVVRDVFEWHPSEGNGLVAAAACGARGVVEIRDHGGGVELTDRSTRVFAVDGRAVQSGARLLHDTASLAEVERRIETLTGRNEVQYERDKARRRAREAPRTPDAATLTQIDEYAAEAQGRAVAYITLRRIAELVGATDQDTRAALLDLIRTERPTVYDPPLYGTRPRASAPSS